LKDPDKREYYDQTGEAKSSIRDEELLMIMAIDRQLKMMLYYIKNNF
jgi:hypothetical protein